MMPSFATLTVTHCDLISGFLIIPFPPCFALSIAGRLATREAASRRSDFKLRHYRGSASMKRTSTASLVGIASARAERRSSAQIAISSRSWSGWRLISSRQSHAVSSPRPNHWRATPSSALSLHSWISKCAPDRPHFVLAGPEGVVSALPAPLTMFHNLIGHAETPTWRSGPYESEGV